MALVYRNAQDKSALNSTSQVFTKPTGVVDGDYMVMQVLVNGSTAPNSVPAGWTLVESLVQPGDKSMYIYTKVAASEPANYTLTWLVSIVVSGGIIAYYSNTATTIVVDDTATLVNASSANRTFPSVTTTIANSVLLMFGTGGTISSTPPGSATERWDTSSTLRTYCMTEDVAAIGATGTRAATGTAQATITATIAIAEQAVLVAPTAPSLLTATAVSKSRINLTWQDNSNNEDNFELQRSLDGSTGWTLINSPAEDAESYSDTGLEYATAYYYRIRAVNTAGNSSYSSTVSAITQAYVSTPKLHLYIHEPTPIFKARVNMASVTYPVSALTFDTVTLGAYTDISFDATLLLGTTEGADDLGRVRVKSVATSTSIPISRASRGTEDGTLNVQDNAYITVLYDFRVWAKIPYFKLDEDGDVDEGVDYKDGDVEVGTYNTNLPPVANTGPGTADYVDPVTGLMTVQFPKGGVDLSYAMADGATIVDHSWDFQGGVTTVGTVDDPVVTVTFEPGFRWISLTVTDSNGVSHTSRCPVLAIDPDDDVTFKDFQVTQNLEVKGQTLDIKLGGDLPRTTYPDGTLVMFWWDEPESPDSRDHMKFVGWVNNENFGMNRVKTGLTTTTNLHCVDVAGRLEVLPGFPQALEREVAEELGQWSSMPSLDINKSLWYLLFWHSTAINLVDFFLPVGGDDYNAMRLDANGGNLFDQVNGQAMKMVPDHYLTCNSQGQLTVTRDWTLDDEGDRPTAAPIITEDYWQSIEAEYNRTPKVHVLRSGAILSSTDWVIVDGEETLPLVFSIAPGEAMAFGQGVAEAAENEGLALSQEDLNKCEGHRYAKLNARFGPFTLKDPTGYMFWDYEPADFKRVQLNIGAAYAAQRGLPFTQATGQVTRIAVNYQTSKRGTAIQPSINWVKEEIGFPASTFIPEDTEDVGYEPPPVVEPAPDLGFGIASDYIVGVGRVPYLCRTSNFTAASPTWDKVDIAFGAEAIPDSFDAFVVDPFSPGYIAGSGNINGFAVSRLAVWKITDMFGATPTATKVYTFDTTKMGSTSSTDTHMIAASFGEFQAEDADNPWLMVTCLFNAAGGAVANDGVWEVHSTDGGQTWSTEQKVTAFANSGTTKAIQQHPAIWLSPRTPGKAILFAQDSNTTTHGYVSTDWGATWTKMTNPLVQNSAGYGGGIHVPWHNNTDENIVYHGHFAGTTPGVWKLKKVTGTTVEDITPTYLGDEYGPVYGLFSVRAHDTNSNYMLMTGATDNVANGTQDEMAIFVSSDAGDTWTMVMHTADFGDFGDTFGWQAAFTSDFTSGFYVWGGSPLVPAMAIGFSEDLGATVDDKSGNLPTLAASDSDINGFIAIAGGVLPTVDEDQVVLWRKWPDRTVPETYTDYPASNTFTVTAFMTVTSGGGVVESKPAAIGIFPPNTKRVWVTYDWEVVKTKSDGGGGANNTSFNHYNHNLLTDTGTSDFSDPVGYNSAGSGSWEKIIYNSFFATQDWYYNTDDYTTEPYSYASAGVGAQPYANGNHTGAGTTTAEMTVTMTVTQIEFVDGTFITY